MTEYRTSGSTGVSKTFTLTPEQEAARAAALPTMRGGGFDGLKSIFISANPQSSSATRHRQWIESAGGVFYEAQANMDANVALILDKKPEGITGAPGFLVNLAGRLRRKHLFDYIGSAGATLIPEWSIKIREGLGDNLWTSYSTSESNTIALASSAQVESERGCVGEIQEGVQVRFDNGEILVKTPTMISGYDAPELTAQFFIDGWFKPGDLGHLNDDGLLVLDGRKKL